jgi:microcystin-dependent protein
MLATPNDSNLLIFAAPVPADNKAMAADSIVVQAAGDASVPVRNPFLGLNYCIALQGLYPERP